MHFRARQPCTLTMTSLKTVHSNPSTSLQNNSNHVSSHTLSLLNFSNPKPQERHLPIYQSSSVVLSHPLRDPSWNQNALTALSSSGWSIEYRLRWNQPGQKKVWTLQLFIQGHSCKWLVAGARVSSSQYGPSSLLLIFCQMIWADAAELSVLGGAVERRGCWTWSETVGQSHGWEQRWCKDGADEGLNRRCIGGSSCATEHEGRGALTNLRKARNRLFDRICCRPYSSCGSLLLASST